MTQRTCPACKKAIPAAVKFCPECGNQLSATRQNRKAMHEAKSSNAKPKKRRGPVKSKKSIFWARVRQELIDTISALSVIIVMPALIITLSHWIGVLAAWIAILIGITYLVLSRWPRPVPMGSTRLKAQLTFIMAFIAALLAYYVGIQTDELADLKSRDVTAYLYKLREYKGHEKWLAAVKELTPEDYAAALKQREVEKADEAKRRLENEQHQRFKEAMARLKERAVETAAKGHHVGDWVWKDWWTLTPKQGLLKCELGPVANGKPRPLVTLKIESTAYALNGAALGTGKFMDGRKLAKNGDISTVKDLIPIGIAMCDALAKLNCGTEERAYDYASLAVKQRMQNPDSANVSMLHATTVMESCGVWLVKSYVDAPNGFGATVRTHFTAEMTRSTDGQWTTKVQLVE